jgi:hypothetical protein
MHLAEVRYVRLFSSKISMSDVRSNMGVSFNAMTCHKHDLALRVLAEIVLAVGGDRHEVMRPERATCAAFGADIARSPEAASRSARDRPTRRHCEPCRHLCVPKT